MNRNNLVAVEEICLHHGAETTFITSLCDYGLVHITTLESKDYIDLEEMSTLERLIRLHYELDINMEGIDAISHLLQRMEQMQQQMRALQRRLKAIEDE